MSEPENASQDANVRHLTPRQEAVALLLASGRTIAEAARDGKAGERSVDRWLTQEAFVARVTHLRAEMISRGLGILADGMVGAGATLRWLSLHAKSEMARLGAARCVIELGVKLRESVELEQRISALEQQQQAEQARSGMPGSNGRATTWR